MANQIAVQGQFQRNIRLGAEVEHAYNYFTDFNHVLPRLPEVDRVLRYRDGRYRMIFSADDGRGHEMGIVFDIRHEVVANQLVKIVPVPVTLQQIKAEMPQNSGPLFPGTFSGETLFNSRPSHTEVIYRVNLYIEIDVPRFLNFMPQKVLQQLGDTLMDMKLHKVADGFAHKVPADFDVWLKNRRKLETEAAQKQIVVAERAADGSVSHTVTGSVEANQMVN